MEFQTGSVIVVRTGSKFSLLGYKVLSPSEYENKNPHLNQAVEIEFFVATDNKWYAQVKKSLGLKFGPFTLKVGFNKQDDMVGPFPSSEAVYAWVGPLPITQKP